MSLEIKNLYKGFEGIPLFRDFSLNLAEGTITCILGPSGCGKTTLLNIIGKILEPESGDLEGFEGKVISYIFQDPRLLPWKTVEDNIGFVLNPDLPSAERKRTVDHFIRLVELDGFEQYYPQALSGGMRQRVSIARAFAYQSDIILMDEPLKGLDIKLKLNLIHTINTIWQKDKRTVVFVTHDVDEALMLGNDVIVLGKAPEGIVARARVDVPVNERSLDLDEIKRVKQLLLNALGS